MPNYTSPMAERVFIQAQPSLTTLANDGSGIWTPAGAQFIQVEENAVTLSPTEPKIALNFKHGSPSPLPSIQGRKGASWSLNAPIIPNGVQGVPPDIDLLLQNIFGGPGAAATGTALGNSWEYRLSSFSSVPLAILGFSHGQTATASRYGVGCITQRATVNFNSNILSIAASGQARAVADIETFPILDPEAQAGLTAFPVEPTTYSSNGSAIHGYGGQLQIVTSDSQNQVFAGMCNSFSMDIATGQDLYGEFVDTLYPAAVLYGPRVIGVSMGFLNNDSAQLTKIKQAARLNEPCNIGFYLGTTPGQRLGLGLFHVQLTTPTLRDSGSYIQLDFGTSNAAASPGQSDDIVLDFA